MKGVGISKPVKPEGKQSQKPKAQAMRSKSLPFVVPKGLAKPKLVEIKCGVTQQQKAWLATVRPHISASALLREAIDKRRKELGDVEKYRKAVDQLKAEVPEKVWEYLAKK